VARDMENAFVGLMYPKRQRFIEQLRPHLMDIPLVVGNIQVQDRGGAVEPRATVAAYAGVLRRIRLLVNFPTLSQLLVTKIFEAAACGAGVVTPQLFGAAQANQPLLDGLIWFYHPDRPADLAQLI